MPTATDCLLTLAYDAERDGYPNAAEGFRKVAHGARDIPGDYTVDEVLEVLQIYRQSRAPAVPDTELRAAGGDEWDDDEARVLFVDESRPIAVEMVGYPGRAWLNFSIGARVPARALIGVDILGGRPGLDLVLRGYQISGGGLDEPALTLEDVRQIHADLGAFLNDERLIGALAEQAA